VALQGVLRPSKQTGVYLTTTIRARKALLAWLEALPARTLEEVAREHKFSVSGLRYVLGRDAKLQEEIFTGLDQQAKLGLVAAMHRGLDYVQAGDSDPKEIRQWAEFFARLTGGMFEAKNRQPLVVLQQLIPDLPPAARDIQVRVLSEPESKSFEALLGSSVDGQAS